MCVLVYPHISTCLQNTYHRIDEVKCKQAVLCTHLRRKVCATQGGKSHNKVSNFQLFLENLLYGFL